MGERLRMMLRRLFVPLAAYVLTAALVWTGCRFAIPGAYPPDVPNNDFVADGIRRWGGFLSVTAVNPLEGMGSLFMPLNPWIASRHAPLGSR